MNEIHILSVKDGCEKCMTFKKQVENIRALRNQRLKETDHYLLPDVIVDEEQLNKIKEKIKKRTIRTIRTIRAIRAIRTIP